MIKKSADVARNSMRRRPVTILAAGCAVRIVYHIKVDRVTRRGSGDTQPDIYTHSHSRHSPRWLRRGSGDTQPDTYLQPSQANITHSGNWLAGGAYAYRPTSPQPLQVLTIADGVARWTDSALHISGSHTRAEPDSADMDQPGIHRENPSTSTGRHGRLRVHHYITHSPGRQIGE